MALSNRKKTHILLVEDHALMRQGLRLLLGQEPSVCVCEAADRHGALAQVARRAPDLIVLDLQLGADYGLDFLPQLLEAAPRTRIVVLAAMLSAEEEKQALAGGVHGIVLKEETWSELLGIMEEVLAGKLSLSPKAIETLASPSLKREKSEQQSSEASLHQQQGDTLAAFSQRDRRIIALLGQEQTIDQVGARLHLSESTVRHCLQRMYRVLGVKGQIGLLLCAQRHGLLDKSDLRDTR